MLNYAHLVEAGRLARALTAAGFALPIGFLHSDKHGRNSLVWDAIEPLRPLIDARVFKFIAQRESGRTFRKRVGTRIGSIARSSPSFCGFRCCRGNGTRTRRDGWRGRLQTPSNNV
jgi:CRISPR associated protein Cas1